MAAKNEREEFFGPTRWSIVQSASGPLDDPLRKRALEQLVEQYRDPISRCLALRLRHSSIRGEAAEEMAISFFAYLIHEDVLRKANRELGPFRSFLQGVMRNWVLSEIRDRLHSHEDIERHEDLAARDESGIQAKERWIWAKAMLDMSLRRLHVSDPVGHEILVRTAGLLGHETETSADLARRFAISVTNVYQKRSVAKVRLREHIEQAIRDCASKRPDAQAEFDEHLRWMLESHPGIAREDEDGASGA